MTVINAVVILVLVFLAALVGVVEPIGTIVAEIIKYLKLIFKGPIKTPTFTEIPDSSEIVQPAPKRSSSKSKTAKKATK